MGTAVESSPELRIVEEHEQQRANRQVVVSSEEDVEPAIRIERTTCGLRISDSPTSDNLTPQETTNQDSLDMGRDGASLSCPGSSEVADADD